MSGKHVRKLTQMLFYRVANGYTGSDKLLQTYGNLCDVPGEYHSSAMLIMPTHAAVHCMPLHCMPHNRSEKSRNTCCADEPLQQQVLRDFSERLSSPATAKCIF
jgi:hypothetical protein